MKKSATLFAVFMLLVATSAWTPAQSLLNEHFDYTSSATDGIAKQSGGVWFNVNSGDSVLIDAGNLSYSGYPTSVGNKIKFDGGGVDPQRVFANQTAGNIYYAFLVNVTSLTGVTSTTGSYFTGLRGGTTSTFGSTIWIKNNDGNSYFLGISPRSSGGTPVQTFTATSYPLNSTLLVVACYQIVNGTTNDVVKLWINPAIGGTEPTPDLTITNNSTNGDLPSVDGVFIRQDATVGTPFLQVDEQRVDTTWMGAVGYVPPTKIYSIGTGNVPSEDGHYTSLKAAIDTLNALQGSLLENRIYYITSDLVEPAACQLGVNTGNNTITFKPYSTVSNVTITFNKNVNLAGNAWFGIWVIGTKDTTTLGALTSTNNIIIDGSKTNGGTTKDLTIKTTGNVSMAYPIRIAGKCDNIVIKNCNLINEGYTGGSSTYVVRVSAKATASAADSIPTNITIQNNYLQNMGGAAGHGILVDGVSTQTAFSNSVTIRDNIIVARTRGIMLNYAGSTNIFNNTFRVKQTSGGLLSYAVFGFAVGGGLSSTINVYNNVIDTLQTAQTTTSGTFGVIGIYCGSTATWNVYNNTIGGFLTTATADPNLANIYGIFASAGTVNASFNTIAMNQLAYDATGNTRPQKYAGIFVSGATVTAKNNIVSCSQTGDSSYALYVSTGTLTSDYNNLYQTNTSGYIGFVTATSYDSLAKWQTASTQDAHSVSGNPKFVSSSNLHINANANPISIVSNAGTNVAGITTDIDGDVRNATTPDIGADEYTADPFVIAPKFSATPASLNFSAVLVNKTKKDSVVVKNTGNDSLFITAVASTNALYTVTPATARIDTGASVKFYVTFSPTAVGSTSSSIVFTDNTTAGKDTVKVKGTAVITVSIAEARIDANNDLIPDHSVLRDTMVVYGVVTTKNFQGTQTSYFMQDATAGINVFSFTPSTTVLVPGDSIMVVGTVLQFRGLTELSPLTVDTANFKVVKKNAAIPAPKQLTLKEFATNAETYEGQLVKVDSLYYATGTWPLVGANSSVYLTNKAKSDTAQMFIDADTELDGSPEPTYPINVTGVVSQFGNSTAPFNTGYEIVPRDSNDIKHVIIASVDDQFSGIPGSYELYNNYPNPFNPSTTILYALPKQSNVTVKVYSILGQEVKTLVNDVQNPSYYRVVWDGTNNSGNHVSSGVYFVRISATSNEKDGSHFTQVKKMLMMK